MKKLLMTAAILAVNLAAFGQANFWNLNGTYMDCNTGGTGTLSSTSYPLYLYQADASSFAIPGLCETYCKLNFTPHGGRVITYKIDHITEGVTTPPSIPGFTSGSYNLGFGYTVYSDASSIAATKLKADGTRDIYAYTTGVILKIATVSAAGAVSLSPTVLHTLPGAWTPSFDRWTAMEVSSDGKYLLLGGTDALTLEVYDIVGDVLTSYPAPGGGSFRIQGFEYVSMGSFLAPRLYVSYNNRSASNPTGTGGVAYYNLGNTSTYTSVTTSVGFGFSEIELAKNGLLYLGYAGSSPAYNFTGTGAVYSLTTGGALSATAFTVPASNNVNYSALCNKYYIQTQIDGEDYDAGSYIAPTVVSGSVKLKSVTGSSTPSFSSTPIIYRCGTEPLNLEASFAGLKNGYSVKVTTGTINSFNNFVPAGGGDNVTYTCPSYDPSYYANNINFALLPFSFVPIPWVGSDWKVEITVNGACSTSTTSTTYYKTRNAGAFVDFKMQAQGCVGITGISRHTSYSIPDASFTTSPCISGWQGPLYVGIKSIDPSGTVGVVTSYNVTIDQVDPSTGAFVANILNDTKTTALPGDYGFNANTSGYFFSNYATLSSTNTPFKVTLTINTADCSASAFSYFRISNGGMFTKTTDNAMEPIEEESVEVRLFPNPANNSFTILLPNTNTPSAVVLMDNTGKKVLRNDDLRSGKNEINIESLPSGIYFYEINVNSTIKHGKLVKQ